MGGESPTAVLYDFQGNELALQNGVAIPANTPLLMIGGSDGTNSRYITLDASGRQIMVGIGVAGTPAGGVVSIQGVAGGTSIPVTLSGGDVTATGSLGALNAAVPIVLQGTNGVAMQLVAGTLVGTIVPEISYDGTTTWNPTFFDDPATGNKVSSIVFASNNTATARVLVSADGASNMRVRVSAYTSGTATCNLRGSSQTEPSVLFSGTAGGVLPPTVVQIGGTDGSNLRTVSTDTSGRQVIVGPGTAGTPAGGVISIQGVSGGQALPVSGTVTANLATGTNAIGRIEINPDITIIHNNATVTTAGSVTISDIGRKEICLGTTINGAVTGTTPTLTYTVSEIDAVGLSTVMTLPGNSVTSGPFNGTAETNYVTMISFTGAVKVSWTLTGTTPSFSGVDTWVAVKEQTLNYGLTQPGMVEPLSAIAMDTNSNTKVVGAAASGAVSGGNPVQVAGFDGTDVRNLLTDIYGSQWHNTSPNLTVIHNNATITTSGSQVITNVGRTEIIFGLAIAGTVSGTTPSLTFTVTEVDGVVNTITMTAPGNTISAGPYTNTNHTNYITMLSFTGAIKVAWTVTGTTPSFGGVYTWIVVKEQSLDYGLNQAGNQLPVSVVNMDANSNTIVVGAAASGAALSGNPVLMAGSDGVDARNLSTNASGNLLVAQAAVAGVALADAWTTKITDATNGPVAVKAASTTAAATDPALVVAISPNLPTLTKGTQGSVGFAIQELKDSGRVPVTLMCSATAGVTSEALLSLTPNHGTTVGSTGTTYTVTSGKTFRITAIAVTVRNTSAVASGAVVRVRTLAGTVLVESPIIFSVGAAVNGAVSGQCGTGEVEIPDGFEISGTQQIGLTQLASATTCTLDVAVIGFEY